MADIVPIVDEQKLQQQKEALGQMKASNKPLPSKMPNDDSKENLFPPSELDDIELKTVKNLKNDENTSDSLKSLDGSIIDNDDLNKPQKQVVESKDKLDNNSGSTTDETTSVDDEKSLKNSNDEDQKNEDELEKSADAISTSDIIADMSSNSEAINPETAEQPLPSSPTDEVTDEQKLVQAQANYGLTSNYKREEVADTQESDSDAELFAQQPNCKCENIRRDPRTKTKVCTIL